MADETKVTKEETLAELKKKVKELEEQVAAKDAEINKTKQDAEGWLVLCKNPAYNGVTGGILFTDGCAFIPKTRVISKYEVLLPSEEKQAEMKQTEEGKKELARIMKAREVPSSERAVKVLVNNFGYAAEFYTKDAMDALQERMSLRAKERADAIAKMPKKDTIMEKLMQPERLGG